MKKMLHILPAPTLSALMTLAVAYLLLTPSPLPEEALPKFLWWDKVAHALLMGTWTLTVMADYRSLRHIKGATGPVATTVMIAVMIALGGLTELIQGTEAVGRSCDISDFMADAVGAVVAGVASRRV